MATNLILLSLFIIVSVGQNTVISVINDLEATYIDNSVQKRGTADETHDTRTTVRLGSRQIGLVRFLMMFGRNGGPEPDDAQIMKATFTVTSLDTGLNAVIFKAQRLWLENNVQWANYRSSVSTSPSLQVATLIYESSQVVHADVTSYLQDLVDSNFTQNDFGWSIVQQGGSSSFYSEDHINLNVRPFLSVEWLCNDNNGCTMDTNIMMNSVCVLPIPVSCNDNIGCTNDLCIPLGPWNQTCSYTEVDSACDQGQRCTLQGCVGTPTTEPPTLSNGPSEVPKSVSLPSIVNSDIFIRGDFVIQGTITITESGSIIVEGCIEILPNTTVIINSTTTGAMRREIIQSNSSCINGSVTLVSPECVLAQIEQTLSSIVVVTSASESCNDKSGTSLNVGMMLGIVFGILMLIAIVLLVIAFVPKLRQAILPYNLWQTDATEEGVKNTVDL